MFGDVPDKVSTEVPSKPVVSIVGAIIFYASFQRAFSGRQSRQTI